MIGAESRTPLSRGHQGANKRGKLAETREAETALQGSAFSGKDYIKGYFSGKKNRKITVRGGCSDHAVESDTRFCVFTRPFGGL